MAKARSKLLSAPSLSFGLGMTYMTLIVLLPIACLVLKAAQVAPADYARVLSASDTLAAFRLSFGQAFLAAAFNTVMGFLLSWVLCRYDFPGRRLLDVMVDLPFALPTAVAGIALCGLYGPHGTIGRLLMPLGIEVAYTPLGIFIAMCFVGVPFVVRTVQPALQNLDLSQEEAAACLGASRWYCVRRVVLPTLMPAILAGFSMSFARGVGEYGSVIFIAGNIPGKTEILPLQIVNALECYDYPAATVLAFTMLTLSFVLLATINLLQRGERHGRD